MQSSVRFSTVSEVFDDAQIVPASGLHPVMALAHRAGLKPAVEQHLHLTGVGKANPAGKVATVVAAMATGADSIDGADVLRTGATGRLFTGTYAPSTLGTFLRSMTPDNAEQWAATGAAFVTGLASHSPLLTPARRGTARSGPGSDLLMLDIDDTVLPVKSHGKEQVGHTYQRCQGLSVQLVTASRRGSRPVILAQELRAGTASGKPGGATSLVTTALTAAASAFAVDPATIVLRGDSAYYSADLVAAVKAAGGYVSVGIKQFINVAALIEGIDPQGWEGIEYPGAVWDEGRQRWDSDAQVAEVPFIGFGSNRHAKCKHVPGRLIVRRVRISDPGTLMPVYRHHAFFTTLPASYSTVHADQIHRGHDIIEQVNADLKGAMLAHLPTTSFAGNTAWVHLAAMAYNLLRAAAALTTALVNTTSASIRAKLVNVPARLSRSGRHITLHLPRQWPWAKARAELSTALRSPPDAALT